MNLSTLLDIENRLNEQLFQALDACDMLDYMRARLRRQYGDEAVPEAEFEALYIALGKMDAAQPVGVDETQLARWREEGGL
ncbi:MAG: hypothetical protein ACYDB1_00615 [Acidiferrobacteraceae bacterium]